MKDRTLVLGSTICLGAFLLLAILVRLYPSGPGSPDFQAAQWVNNLQVGSAVDSVLVSASLYGREYFWIAVVALMLLLGDRQTKLLGLGLCGLFVAGIVAGEVAKEVVARPRPAATVPINNLGGTTIIARITLDTDFSFPSGHALIVSIGAVYSLISFRKKWVAGLLTAEAAVVCFSRVYVGAHYPTDVLGGVLLAAAIVLSGIFVGRKYLQKQLEAVADALSKALGKGLFGI